MAELEASAQKDAEEARQQREDDKRVRSRGRQDFEDQQGGVGSASSDPPGVPRSVQKVDSRNQNAY